MIFKAQVFEGLTGPVEFEANGNRKNYKIGVYNLEMNSRLAKVRFSEYNEGLIPLIILMSFKKDWVLFE